MKKNRLKIVAYAAVTGVCLAVLTAFSALADTVYVNADNLNYRSAPSTDSTVLGTLSRGQKLERENSGEEWSTVTVGGQKCYVASRYLSANQPKAAGTAQTPEPSQYVDKTWDVALDGGYRYAEFSKINSGKAIYYQNGGENRKGKTVCVNAGHGTSGGGKVKTLCHPDGTEKVTGGTTGAGATSAAAVSSGMTFADKTAESKVTLAMAKTLKNRLLAEGYDVLMIREGDDVQLDNVARTVLANNNADCHISLHWDSTNTNKGCFYMSVPSNKTYRAMEPVASHWQSHNKLGACLISGLQTAGNKIFSDGSMEMDLTQTSYSTVPSVDIELGDKASGHSQETLEKLADGLMAGINQFFEK